MFAAGPVVAGSAVEVSTAAVGGEVVFSAVVSVSVDGLAVVLSAVVGVSVLCEAAVVPDRKSVV